MSCTESTPANSNRIVIDLDAATSSRLLEQAARRGAAVTLTYQTKGAEERVAGCVTAVDANALHIDTASAASGPLPTTYVHGSLDLGGEEYLFSAIMLSVAITEHGREIILARPAMLQTWQRRRFLRADVAESTVVNAYPAEGAELPVAEGLLLNVSPDGLAFRTDRGSADLWGVDDRLRVQFALRTGRPRLEFIAVVRTKTPAGTAGSIIVGVQFTDAAANAAPRNQLESALRAFADR
jgi:hypothetical protein